MPSFPLTVMIAIGLIAVFLLATGFRGGHFADPDEARALVQDGAILVDVRTPGEFQQHHIPGAINIPLQELERRLAELPGTDEEIVLYCRSGNRSNSARQILERQGFEKVHDLGAISRWPRN